MKKTLVLLSMAVPAFAGVAPLAPAPVLPPAPSPLSFEVGMGYNWASRDLIKHSAFGQKEIDTIGFDITGIYALTENHSLNLRLGYAFGDEKAKDSIAALAGADKHETDLHVFTIMPGYRYTHALTDTLSVYAGANVGLAVVSVKDHLRAGAGTFGSHGSEAGFAYSAEIGVNHKITDTIGVFAAWQVAGNTATPELYYNYVDTSKQVTTGIRAGVSIKF